MNSKFTKKQGFINRKMIVIILIFVLGLAIFIWNKSSEQDAINHFQIPESNNITYETGIIKSVSPSDILNELESNIGRPILLHLYTTWCSVCKKQLPEINELSRKFQNTDLKLIVVAIDKNITTEDLTSYLNYYGNIYFEVRHLVYSDGLAELLKQRSIPYDKKIPFTVLISQSGEVVNRFNGYKNKNYLQKRIVKLLESQQ